MHKGRGVRLLLLLFSTAVIVGVGLGASHAAQRSTSPVGGGLEALMPGMASAGGSIAVSASSSATSAATRSGVSAPVRAPALRELGTVRPGKSHREARREGLKPYRFHLPSNGSTALQTWKGPDAMPAPLFTFEGINNMCNCYPPDTNGDVGPNHYMEWVNDHFAIYSKTGGPPLVGPLPGNSLFNPVQQPVCGTANQGDPIVLYDQYSGRWLASQFAWLNINTGPFYQCVAVSSTNDPTGTWCSYEYQIHPTKLNDYPKFGVWPSQNAYFMTINQFNVPGFSWGGQGIVAFERDKMINCQAAKMAYKDMFSVDANLGGMLPADADGPNAPPGDGPRRKHGHRLLARKRDGAELRQHLVRGASRDCPAEPAHPGRGSD